MREQLFRGAGIERLLHLRRLLRRLPEGVVQVRVLLEVLGLEVVVPQHVEVVLHELRALLLDVNAAGAEELVVAGIVLLDDAQARLGLDPGLLWVVHAAGNVAVRVDDAGRAQDGAQGKHRSPLSGRSLARGVFILGRCKPRAVGGTYSPGPRVISPLSADIPLLIYPVTDARIDRRGGGRLSSPLRCRRPRQGPGRSRSAPRQRRSTRRRRQRRPPSRGSQVASSR